MRAHGDRAVGKGQAVSNAVCRDGKPYLLGFISMGQVGCGVPPNRVCLQRVVGNPW